MTTHIPDEMLTAYVEGELDEAARARVEQAIAHDARLAQRVAQQRAQRVRRERLPQRLVNAARLDGAAGPAQIIDLARVRAARARRPERRRAPISRRTATIIGASLLAGLGVGSVAQHLWSGSGLTEYRDGALLASGSLERALNEQPAGTTTALNVVRIGFSFRSKSGSYCRTFAFNSRHVLAGFACREQQSWRILTLLASDLAGSPSSPQVYRMTSSAMPPALLQAVNERISGEPLDVSAESKMRRSGWH